MARHRSHVSPLLLQNSHSAQPGPANIVSPSWCELEKQGTRVREQTWPPRDVEKDSVVGAGWTGPPARGPRFPSQCFLKHRWVLHARGLGDGKDT